MSLLAMLGSMSGMVSNIGPSFKTAGKMAIDAFKNLWEWIDNNLIQPFRDFFDWMGGAWDGIKEAGSTSFQAIWDFIDSVLIQPFVSFIELFSWENIKTAGEVTFDAIWTVIDTLLIQPFVSFIELFSWENIKTAGEVTFNALWSVIDTIFISPWKTFFGWFETIWTNIYDGAVFAFESAWNFIDFIFISPIKTTLDWLSSAWDSVYDGVTGAFSSAWGFIDNNFISPVLGFIDNLSFDSILDGITSAFTSAWDFISGIGTDIKDMFVSLGTDLAGVLKSPINGFIGAVNSLFASFKFSKTIDLPGLDPFTVGFDLSDWNIPMLAKGGIVTKPTLAMIGEGGGPEAVIPLDKAGGMGTQNFNITVNASGITDRTDKRTLAREIGNMIQQEMARNIGGTTMRGRY